MNNDLISGTCSHLPTGTSTNKGLSSPILPVRLLCPPPSLKWRPVHATARRWSALFDLPMTTRAGNPALRIGDKYFQFNQGNSNALVQLDFLTDTAALKGQTICGRRALCVSLTHNGHLRERRPTTGNSVFTFSTIGIRC
ncbi:hypothetical protein [Klebsiella quasipneumoniae]|uniref:hypothetical protein n=1 Tax=Klebsiella quasipneumoniae TaxID=1463165 RepID=UPI00388DD60A